MILNNSKKLHWAICCGELGGADAGDFPDAPIAGGSIGFGSSGGNVGDGGSANAIYDYVFDTKSDKDLSAKQKELKAKAEDKSQSWFARAKAGMNLVATLVPDAVQAAFGTSGQIGMAVAGAQIASMGFDAYAAATKADMATGMSTGTSTGGSQGGKFIPKLTEDQYKAIANEFGTSVNDVKTAEGEWVPKLQEATKAVTDQYTAQLKSGLEGVRDFSPSAGASGNIPLTDGEHAYLLKQFGGDKKADQYLSNSYDLVKKAIDSGFALPTSLVKKLLDKGDGGYTVNSDGVISIKQKQPDYGSLVTDQFGLVQLDNNGNVIASSGIGGSNMADTASETTENPIQNEDLWSTFVKKVTDEMQGLIDQDTQYKQDQTNQYNQTISNATNQHASLLDKLTNDMSSQSGVYKPVSTKAGTIQPYTNSMNAKSMLSLADKKKDSLLSAAQAKYNTMADNSPVKSQLEYFDKLGVLAGADKNATLEEKKLAIQKYLGEMGANTNLQMNQNNNEVGWLDYVNGFGNLAQNVTGLFS